MVAPADITVEADSLAAFAAERLAFEHPTPVAEESVVPAEQLAAFAQQHLAVFAAE